MKFSRQQFSSRKISFGQNHRLRVSPYQQNGSGGLILGLKVTNCIPNEQVAIEVTSNGHQVFQQTLQADSDGDINAPQLWLLPLGQYKMKVTSLYDQDMTSLSL